VARAAGGDQPAHRHLGQGCLCLGAASKSTIANELEKRLASAGYHTMLLDGDNLRHGLNCDLSFTASDRGENIRRAGEVARLMVEAGLIVICSFISPYRANRDVVRALVLDGEFMEVFVDTPLEECARRDRKGLYDKAAKGQIKNLTGFDSPYEPPEAPDIWLKTIERSVPDLVGEVLRMLEGRGAIVLQQS
jgi:bifunctional enzyme CysN/CysC